MIDDNNIYQATAAVAQAFLYLDELEKLGVISKVPYTTDLEGLNYVVCRAGQLGLRPTEEQVIDASRVIIEQASGDHRIVKFVADIDRIREMVKAGQKCEDT